MTPKTPAEIQNLLLAQLAAESYLADYLQMSTDEMRSRLKLGSNHYDFLPQGANANTASLPAQTRMTGAQVTEFNGDMGTEPNIFSRLTMSKKANQICHAEPV